MPDSHKKNKNSVFKTQKSQKNFRRRILNIRPQNFSEFLTWLFKLWTSKSKGDHPRASSSSLSTEPKEDKESSLCPPWRNLYKVYVLFLLHYFCYSHYWDLGLMMSKFSQKRSTFVWKVLGSIIFHKNHMSNMLTPQSRLGWRWSPETAITRDHYKVYISLIPTRWTSSQLTLITHTYISLITRRGPFLQLRCV